METKECGCPKHHISECERKGGECYLIWNEDGYLQCIKCGTTPNEDLDGLCMHDFIEDDVRKD